MKRLLAIILFLLLAQNASAFDIYALGTSATNCKGVPENQSFAVKLQEYLQTGGLNARVINGGINGDRPVFMINRVESVLDKAQHPDVKLVIFEPGPNERNPRMNRQASEEVLAKLQKANMPTIYASPWAGGIQTAEEGAEIAEKYNAYYYGPWSKGVTDNDPEWRQFDYATPWGGHMTAKGCAKVAEQMAVLVTKVVKEKNIR